MQHSPCISGLDEVTDTSLVPAVGFTIVTETNSSLAEEKSTSQVQSGETMPSKFDMADSHESPTLSQRLGQSAT